MLEMEITQVAARCLSRLKFEGFDVLACDDFERVSDLFPETGRHAQTPMMDVRRLDFTQGQAFWLFVTQEDAVVGGLAAKSIKLKNERFDDFLRRTTKHQYGFELDPIAEVATPVVEAISGDLIYFGELEFKSDFRGNASVLRDVSRVSKCLAAMRWPDFDWMYSFIPDEHFKFAKAYDFNLVVPEAIRWSSAPSGRLNSHWIMANNSSQFIHWIGVRQRELTLHPPE
ncbi:MAG: hypothetical protein ABJL99_10035 [Aliishimia sp.]